jgi:hypothetical protein
MKSTEIFPTKPRPGRPWMNIGFFKGCFDSSTIQVLVEIFDPSSKRHLSDYF